MSAVNPSLDASPVVRAVLEAEHARIRAMLAGDEDALRQLLHPDLIHVHANGRSDTRDSYLSVKPSRVRYSNIQRFDDLRVRPLAGTAVMTGRQLLEGQRMPAGERVRIDSHVLQVWTLEDGRWLQIAFQTTPIKGEA
jgi:hypothetical protein